MTEHIRLPLKYIVFVWVMVVWAGCGAERGHGGKAPRTPVERAQEFRRHLAAEEFEAARDMMTADPRRWFDAREGAGQPWAIGRASGPWANWDAHFRSRKEVVRWTQDDGAAVLVQRETNDYFQLLERGWVTNEIVYFVDDTGKIEGLLIRAVGDRPPGRTDEFLAWAREHDPVELEYVMPGGEINPAGDRPSRVRALLNRWREAAGLPTIP